MQQSNIPEHAQSDCIIMYNKAAFYNQSKLINSVSFNTALTSKKLTKQRILPYIQR